MANRYWVGGTGNWDNTTTHWSATSGGAGGATVPTVADNVFFDANSASGNYTVTITGLSVGDMNIAKPTAGTLTLAGTVNMTCGGSMNVVATGVTWTYSGLLQFVLGSSGILSRTINMGGLVIASTIYFNAVGVTWQLLGDMVTTNLLQAANGTVDLNNYKWQGQTMNCGGGSVKTFAFGTSGSIVLTGSGGVIWNNALATGLFLTGTSNITLNYSGSVGTRNIAQGTTGAAPEAQTPNFNITAGSDIITAVAQIGDLNFTGFTGTLTNATRTIYGNLTLSSGMTLTAGTLTTTFAGTTSAKTITTAGKTLDFPITFGGVGTYKLLDNLSMGPTVTSIPNLLLGTFDLNGFTVTAPAFTGTNSNTRSINMNGNINITGNSTIVWNFAISSNFSYTGNGTVNFFSSATTGNRYLTHGHQTGNITNRMPPMNVSGGSDSFMFGNGAGVCYFSDTRIVGFNGTLYSYNKQVSGNFIQGPVGTMLSGLPSTTFVGSGNQIVDTYNVNTPWPFNIASTGNVILANNFNNYVAGGPGTMSVSSGNFIANGKTIQTGSFSSTGTSNRSIDISNVTLTTLYAATAWNVSNSNITLNASNSTIVLANNSTTARTFAGAGLTYGNLVIGGGTATSTTTISGNNTFNYLVNGKNVAQTLTLTSGDTQTFNGWTWGGAAGKVATLNSTVAGSPHYIVLTTGNVSTIDYLNIKDSSASPTTNTWYAGAHSVDSGNNTGWIFPAGSSAYFLLF